MGITDNPGIEFYISGRRGLLAKIPEITQSCKLRDNSFMVRGPLIFNGLPIELRNFDLPPEVGDNQNDASYIKVFKRNLDKFLSDIPDKPNLDSPYASCINVLSTEGKKSNSLVDILR